MWTTTLFFVTFAQIAAEYHIGVLHDHADGALALPKVVRAALEAEKSELEHTVRWTEPGEPLAPLRELCTMGATALLLVPADDEAANRAAAAASRAGIVLLPVSGAPLPASSLTVTLAPSLEDICLLVYTMMLDKGWLETNEPSPILLHEDHAPAELLALGTLRARRVPAEDAGDAALRGLLLPLKRAGSTRFVVWTRTAEGAARLLTAASRAGLLAERHSYIMLHLDLHMLALANYSYGGANITGIRLFDSDSSADGVRAVHMAWRFTDREGAAPTTLALTYDAVRLAVRAWRDLQLSEALSPDCSIPRAGLHAETLVNHMRTMRLEGSAAATGEVRLDEKGKRRSPSLQVVELERGGGLQVVASWKSGLRWLRETPPQSTTGDDGAMTNRTFNVLIAFNDPYVMRRESKERLSGNDRYEGFCIELIQRLAEALHFNYTFVLQEDGKYGSLVDPKRGIWNGMMGRLISDPEIHFAITDLTITAEREKFVDFTTPFMNLGISILFKRPEKPEPEVFAFLLPFSNGVWLCLGLAYAGASLALFLAGRLCPAEWQNPYPCVEQPTALQNQFSLANALWFNLGSVLLQGSEIAPAALGTRAAASIWWLFALVITSSYTANLATLLAKKANTELIHNVVELANNPYGISYGAKLGGSTLTFFEHSQNPLYKDMYEQMREITMPTTNADGVNRVINEDFAFLMESTTIEYLTQRNCNVTQVGGLLDNKGYGIAMTKNSTYRQALNLALLNLQERGVLREMKHIWWKEKHGGGSCNDNDGEGQSENSELSMNNFLGLFLVLGVGASLGVLLSLLELVRHAARAASRDGVGLWTQLRAELAFVFRFARSIKPLQLPLPVPESGSGPESRRDSGQESGPETRLEQGPEPDSPARLPSRRRSTQHSIHTASVKLARHASGRRS